MASLTTKQRLFVGLQKLLPRTWLTRRIYSLTRIRIPWIKNLTIRTFVKAFNVQIDNAAASVPDGYASFNDFFTRALREDARVVCSATEGIASPCDGRLSQCGNLSHKTLVQAKGLDYSLDELLGSTDDADVFRNGVFATIYLAPFDYHRVHCPDAAVLLDERTLGYDLFSVNGDTAAAIDNLFIKNERRVMLFDSAAGRFALVMVGAMNVGSVTTVWDGETRAGFRSPQSSPLLPEPRDASLSFQRGDLLGWFNMGSTVIFIGEESFEILPDHSPGKTVRMGDPLARRAATAQ